MSDTVKATVGAGDNQKQVTVPVDPSADTNAAAAKAVKAEEKRNFTQSIEKGADREFNTWLRKAHEQGNPEQLSPMQAEQNIRDQKQDVPGISELHDLSHEDTRWVVQNVLGEQIPADA